MKQFDYSILFKTSGLKPQPIFWVNFFDMFLWFQAWSLSRSWFLWPRPQKVVGGFIINKILAGSTISTLLNDKINPKDCQVLSLGDSGFLQFFRVVSSDDGKPRPQQQNWPKKKISSRNSPQPQDFILTAGHKKCRSLEIFQSVTDSNRQEGCFLWKLTSSNDSREGFIFSRAKATAAHHYHAVYARCKKASSKVSGLVSDIILLFFLCFIALMVFFVLSEVIRFNPTSFKPKNQPLDLKSLTEDPSQNPMRNRESFTLLFLGQVQMMKKSGMWLLECFGWISSFEISWIHCCFLVHNQCVMIYLGCGPPSNSGK